MEIVEEEKREIRIIFPEEFFSIFSPKRAFHLVLNVEKKFLLALRSLIDVKIEALEKEKRKRIGRKKEINTE